MYYFLIPFYHFPTWFLLYRWILINYNGCYINPFLLLARSWTERHVCSLIVQSYSIDKFQITNTEIYHQWTSVHENISWWYKKNHISHLKKSTFPSKNLIKFRPVFQLLPYENFLLSFENGITHQNKMIYWKYFI